MEARILGREEAEPALDLVGRRHRWVGSSVTNRPLSFVFLDTSASSEGWHVQWERVPPGKKLAPRSLSHVRGGNETDEAD